LVETFDAAFAKARHGMGWQKGETLRLVVASFKPFKDREAAAVNRLRDKLSDFTVECAFLHVIASHPSMLIDMGERGAKAGYDKVNGVHTPQRSLDLPLSKNQCLITTTGPEELKKFTDGIPAPIWLSLHRDANFTATEHP